MLTEPDDPLVFRASFREAVEALYGMQIREELNGLSMYQFAWQLLTFSFTDLVEDLLLTEPDESRASLREEAEVVCT